jgi:hypothetical protein
MRGGQPKVMVCGTELTGPYAVLLADGLARELDAEATAYGSGNLPLPGVQTTNGASNGASPVSNFDQMVPGVGFEPTRPCERRILSPLRLPFRHPGR